MKVVLDGLSKIYQDRNDRKKQVVAADNLTFEIPDGKLVALLGPSGCGKSTTLNMICGLEEPTSGRLYFGDDDVTDLPPEVRGVGMVFQNYALYPHLTVKKNIMFPLENLKGAQKLSKEAMEAKVLQTAKVVQIDNLLDRKPSEMSGGQQQRVAIARALVKRPKVLLLDEPLSNLDARLRLQTREEIRRIQMETKITTVFVTHDQEEAMSISDLIIVLKAGAVQQIGKPQEVYDNPCNLFVSQFLGTPQINTFNGCIRDNRVYIGDEAVLRVKELPDQEVYVCIRPEGFILDDAGTLSLELKRVEVMGRDTSVISTHSCSENVLIRSIIPTEQEVDVSKTLLHFTIKPFKCYLFAKDSQERIYFDVEE